MVLPFVNRQDAKGVLSALKIRLIAQMKLQFLDKNVIPNYFPKPYPYFLIILLQWELFQQH